MEWEYDSSVGTYTGDLTTGVMTFEWIQNNNLFQEGTTFQSKENQSVSLLPIMHAWYLVLQGLLPMVVFLT